MNADRTSRQPKAHAQQPSPGRKGRPSRRRGSASSRPKAMAVAPSAPACAASSVKRGTRKPAPTKASRPPTPEQDLRVALPGTLCQRDSRWWWDVKLPGEEESKARPLRPEGADEATDDLGMAQNLALAMWEQALSETVERRIKAETSQTIARLKAQFLEKVRDFSQVVETTKARLEAETQAKAEAEAKLRDLACRAAETTVCECCGAAGIPVTSVRRIDSGQLLCPNCLAALRAEVRRISSQEPAECCV